MKVKELITQLLNEDMDAELFIHVDAVGDLDLDGISRKSDGGKVIFLIDWSRHNLPVT